MALLIHSNQYLRDPVLRKRMLEDSVRQSSIFEGARGLKKPAQRTSSKRRVTASTKKSASKAKLPE